MAESVSTSTDKNCHLTSYQYWRILRDMPAVQPSSTSGTPIIAPAIQSQVIALRAAGKSKRKIAEELGIHRNTVSNVIEHMQADVPDYSAIVHKLAGRALTRIDQVIDTDTDTAKWTLEHTVFRPDATDSPVVHDNSLNVAIGFVPTSTTSLPSSTGTPGSTPTEAPAKPGIASLSLSNHTNFSEFSLAELEQHRAALDAELARRRSQVIDAEVVP